MSLPIAPHIDKHGVGICTHQCGSFNPASKVVCPSCDVMGMRVDEGLVCEPWARELVAFVTRSAKEDFAMLAELQQLRASILDSVTCTDGSCAQCRSGEPCH